jgi:hypothetical protein
MIDVALLDSGQLSATRRDADVLVVGGGTAGFVAAIAAAREGAQTVLAEYLPFLGGTHGGGAMVMGTIGYRVTGAQDTGISAAEELVTRGIALEYYDRMVAANATYGIAGDPTNAWPKDLELSKVVIESMAVEAGVDIWFTTMVVDVVSDGDALIGALLLRGGELTFVRVPVVVDATGDAIVALKAGARYEMGRPTDHKTEAATLYFEIGGVDVDRLLDHLEAHPEDISEHHRARGIGAASLRQDLELGRPFVVRMGIGYGAGDLPTPVGAAQRSASLGTFWMHWRDGQWVPSMFSVNMDTTYGVDPRDRDQMDRFLVETRAYVLDMVRHYQRHAPGFKDAFLLRFATTMGIREGPRIVGDYTLSADDVFAPSDYPDAIGRCGARVDIHPEDDGGREFLLRTVGGDRGWFQIPYRSLLPAGVDGVIVAGRCISADHIAHGSIRHQAVCMVTGQAAGTAAALAAIEMCSPRALAVETIRERLRHRDVLI